MLWRAFFRVSANFLGFFAITGCGSVKYSSVAGSILNRNWTVTQESPPERDYCTAAIPHGSFYSISGKASYQYRPIGTEVTDEGLLDVAEEVRPIRHAQFDVTDAGGTIYQCGETDGDGNFSFIVPQNDRALSLNIYARSNNDSNKASVFIAPETNELHKLQYFFTANNNRANLSLIAEAKNSLIGGAFNILDQIHNSFDELYVNTNVGEGIDPADIPKVDIYWEKGFNPGVYVGVDSGLSFFSKPKSKLFILGGLNGDTDFADTDHFDNSIILHEYFHFLESAVSRSDSPGGPHDGNQLLDPRLAWSEGAAQFFQAFVTKIPTVLDTRGNSDGSTGFYLKLSVENENTDIPVETGEGEFREFAVARTLWDIHDTEDGEVAPEGFDNINGYFSNFWRAFSGSGTSADFNHATASFASSGLLLDIIDFISNVKNDSAWNELLLHSFMSQPIHSPTNNFRAKYALPLALGTTSPFEFKGPFFYTPNSYLPNNHPVASMNSYTVQVPANSSQLIAFTQNASDNTEAGEEGSMQMYVFEEGYQDLSEFIAGPFDSGQNVSLEADSDGSTFLIVIVISDLPVKDPVATGEVVMNYQFTGFTQGGF